MPSDLTVLSFGALTGTVNADSALLTFAPGAMGFSGVRAASFRMIGS
jgi:hypothetical protein